MKKASDSEKKSFDNFYLDSLKPGDSTYIRMESGKPGFGIRVYPSGQKTFFFRYKVDGTSRFMELGNYPKPGLAAAREKYTLEQEKVKALRRGSKDGADPVLEKKLATEKRIAEEAERKKQFTFDELARAYIAEQIEGQVVDKSVYDIKRVLLGAIDKKTGKLKDGCIDDFKEWRNRKAADITQEDAATLLRTVAKRFPAAARNIIKTARPMFAYALPRNIVKINPFQMAGTKTYLPKKVKSSLTPTVKQRTLDEIEIRILWKALAGDCKGSKEAKNAIRLMLLLGQRPTEILGMDSSEISSQWWTIPKERTKARLDQNRRDHSVYLTDEALSIIGLKKGLIFESRNRSGEGTKEHITVNSIGDMIRDNNYFGLPAWGSHDLRRTMRTFMSDIDGISVKASEAVINHALEGTKKNYDHHKYLRQIQGALTLWRDKLVEIIGEPLVKPLPDNVIPISTGKKAV